MIVVGNAAETVVTTAEERCGKTKAAPCSNAAVTLQANVSSETGKVEREGVTTVHINGHWQDEFSAAASIPEDVRRNLEHHSSYATDPQVAL